MRARSRLLLVLFVAFTGLCYLVLVPPQEGAREPPYDESRNRPRPHVRPQADRPAFGDSTDFDQNGTPYRNNFDPTDKQFADKTLDAVKIFKSTMVDFTVGPDVDLRILEKHYVEAQKSFVSECNQTETLRKFSLKTKGFFSALYPKTARDNFERFVGGITGCDLYPENSEVVDGLLQDMNRLRIKSVAIMGGGTQIKLKLTFENGKKALFKPLRFHIDYESHPNHFYFSDFERANAEIAAFHMSKVLNRRWVPPTVGRVLNLTQIKAVSEHALAKTFFFSPAKNLCFVGKCDYYCDTTHAICGRPDTIRGSVQVFMPDEKDVPRDHIKSLYRRSYSKRHQTTIWQDENSFCEDKVKNHIPYASFPRRLLDLVDVHIFDFLMGNLDRHHIEVLDVFRFQAFPVIFDNGRGFGRSGDDFTDILAPLYQCCVVRASTVRTLLDYQLGPTKLSAALRQSLSADPIAPLLTDAQLAAVDRRVDIVLRTVLRCVLKSGNKPNDVIRSTYVHPNPVAESVEEESE